MMGLRRLLAWRKVRTFTSPPLLPLDTHRWFRVRMQGFRAALQALGWLP